MKWDHIHDQEQVVRGYVKEFRAAVGALLPDGCGSKQLEINFS